MKTLPTNRVERLVAMLTSAVIAPGDTQCRVARQKAEAFIAEARMPDGEVRAAMNLVEQLLHRPKAS
jgi:hypothetical protein